MENKIELKVGDQLYRSYGNNITELITVDRVTKTQAISNDVKFKKFQFEDSIRAIGSNTWSQVSYKFRTPKLDNKFKKQQIITALSVKNWAEYDLETLISVWVITKNNK